MDRHRRQITFDAVEVESGREWKSRLWQPDRERFRRWLRDDVAERANGSPVAIAVEGCTDWRYVVEEVLAAGFEAHLAEPADTKAARGRKRHAKTDRTDCRLLREPLVDGRLPRSWIPPTLVLEWRERVRLWSINADVGAAHPRRVVSARRVVAGELDSLGRTRELLEDHGLEVSPTGRQRILTARRSWLLRRAPTATSAGLGGRGTRRRVDVTVDASERRARHRLTAPGRSLSDPYS